MEGSAAAILDELYRMRFEMVRTERPGATFIGGGTLTTDAGHILFVGEPGGGKSTLLTHLADLGWPVSGDQQLIVEEGSAMPFPNTLRVRRGALALLSARAADIVRASPRIPGWFDNPTYSVAPSAFGRPWKIRPAPLLDVVVVCANHGGGSRLKPLHRAIAMEMMFRDLVLPDTGRANAFAMIHRLISSAGCWELSSGRLDGAQRLLQGLIGLERQGGLSGARHAER